MASPVDTSVKFFRNDFPGAPVLDGVAGAANALFDACLCNGFGLRTATSVVVDGGVATVTLPSDAKNPNLLRSVILVDGVTGALTALNGEQRVTAASTTTLQFATAAASGTATGTITIKTAPAGWEKRFSGTHKAVYRSLAPESLGMHLWVDDTGDYSCRVRGFEAMTDVDTGTGPFPTTGDAAGGGYWIKSYAAGARWDFAADSRAFIYSPVPTSASSPSQIGQTSYFFGDLLPYKSGDAFACGLTSSKAAVGAYDLYCGSVLFGGQGGSASMCRLARSHTGLGAVVPMFAAAEAGGNVSLSGADGFYGTFPADSDGGLRLCRMVVTETVLLGSSTTVMRGVLPGVYYSPQTGLGSALSRGDTIALADRRLYVVSANSAMLDTGTQGGRGFIDITGPWR